eukprot:TRINITY_DN3754_c1_g1_i1.p1 TRINITY_DN3754_c1_g1~~TRINITY_DN3754_c1_g1_i1.p1  ORF type:complete len:212 (+),score=23.05 TRINITY_DN3754_c1_g1_i1:43-678(+)
MHASVLIVLVAQCCHVTSGDSRFLGGLGRLLHDDKNAVFAPCKDDSKPVCPDGSEPNVSSRPPSCSSGSPLCADGSTPIFGNNGCRGKGAKRGKGGRGDGDARPHNRRLQNRPRQFQEGDSEECDEEGEGMPPVVLGLAIGGSVCGLCICVGVCFLCRRKCVLRSKESPNSKTNGKAATEPDALFVVGHPLEGDMPNTKNTADGAPFKSGA